MPGFRSGCQHFPYLPGYIPGANDSNGTAEPEVTSEPEVTPEPTHCEGSHKSCDQANCPHELTWIQYPNTDEITFTMTADISDTEWLAVGFSSDKNMVNDHE